MKVFIRPLRHQPVTTPAASTRAFLRGCAAGALACVLTPHSRARQNAEPVAVLYPDLAQPYRKIFTDILGGMQAHLPHRLRAYPITPGAELAELTALAQTLRRHGTRVVVALGRQGLRAAAVVQAPLGTVIGAVSSVADPETHIGVCLTPDPALLFARLKTLLPATRRVLMVYSAQHSDWLLRLARDCARTHGLELAAFEAGDLAAAARLYRSAIGAADGRRDALWLPADPITVDEQTILPLVLRASWNRNVPIFSSSFSHVNKGVLFSLYPNNADLGRSLAGLATGLVAGIAPVRGITPLRDVHAALNTRTASHFGIALDPALQRTFHTLLPAA